MDATLFLITFSPPQFSGIRRQRTASNCSGLSNPDHVPWTRQDTAHILDSPTDPCRIYGRHRHDFSLDAFGTLKLTGCAGHPCLSFSSFLPLRCVRHCSVSKPVEFYVQLSTHTNTFLKKKAKKAIQGKRKKKRGKKKKISCHVPYIQPLRSRHPPSSQCAA